MKTLKNLFNLADLVLVVAFLASILLGHHAWAVALTGGLLLAVAPFGLAGAFVGQYVRREKPRRHDCTLLGFYWVALFAFSAMQNMHTIGLGWYVVSVCLAVVLGLCVYKTQRKPWLAWQMERAHEGLNRSLAHSGHKLTVAYLDDISRRAAHATTFTEVDRLADAVDRV